MILWQSHESDCAVQRGSGLSRCMINAIQELMEGLSLSAETEMAPHRLTKQRFSPGASVCLVMSADSRLWRRALAVCCQGGSSRETVALGAFSGPWLTKPVMCGLFGRKHAFQCLSPRPGPGPSAQMPYNSRLPLPGARLWALEG